ncbi:uncharacterized protein LAESUDRAFT_713672 [Laetiporus sulphureus 93-53]|uniref:Uncharacterized protein n=1 Tax=Laetiporus sulphureus 93-53 TaxID=1314785 RepID=A0A165EJ92_9APHY|nr:uncharacterized protein LAESUDRAFT_713672 [Laetiporus sulphureus 93-53]KZT07166.1 hypothetical protein LAESUDRAFT_713672 [Laetiporus sulphureus 93-53]
MCLPKTRASLSASALELGGISGCSPRKLSAAGKMLFGVEVWTNVKLPQTGDEPQSCNGSLARHLTADGHAAALQQLIQIFMSSLVRPACTPAIGRGAKQPQGFGCASQGVVDVYHLAALDASLFFHYEKLDLAEIGPAVFCALLALIMVTIRKVRSLGGLSERTRLLCRGRRRRSESQEHPVKFDYPTIQPFKSDNMTLKLVYSVTIGIRSMNGQRHMRLFSRGGHVDLKSRVQYDQIDRTFFDYHTVVEHRLPIRGVVAIVNPTRPGIHWLSHSDS